MRSLFALLLMLPLTAVVAQDADPNGLGRGFHFGSYGRVQFTSDLDGHPGREINVVSHGPRLAEESYVELDFGYGLARPDLAVDLQFTLALFEPFYHYSGDAQQYLAVRNLYAEASQFLPRLSLWVGSRMYRGDDVYLLDCWPLDNLNTIGGGVGFADWGLDLRAHMGVNRLNNDYQLQTIEIPNAGFGSSEYTILDRQRWIYSLRSAYRLSALPAPLGMDFVLYGEFHRLPQGERIPPELIEDQVPDYDPEDIKDKLPQESGYKLGGEVSLIGIPPQGFIKLFVAYAADLAAYGEWGVPWGLNTNGKTRGASELTLALSGNWESRWVGVMLGAEARRFEDADPNEFDIDDYWEGVAVLRPIVYITDHFHQGLEISYQQHYPFGLDPSTDEQEVPEVWQLSVLELLSWDRGNYARPQFRLVYTLSKLNSAARRRFPEGDTRRNDELQHFIGLGVEWWFDSSYR
ncbi:MAG: carbohydrate porin [Candidatus Alcyoniella australis]|nr:carbohydrate porin [Candidatus Alcyoniella australis]